MSTLDRIEKIEKEMQMVKYYITTQEETVQFVTQKCLSIEQSYAALAKTLTALIDELVQTQVVNDETVMRRIREIDERSERERIQNYREHGVLKSSDVVSSTSVVAIKQTVMETHPEKGTREVLISGYGVRQMQIPKEGEAPTELQQKLVGLKIGGSAEIGREEHDGGVAVLTATVLEIYEWEPDKPAEEGTSGQGKDAPQS